MGEKVEAREDHHPANVLCGKSERQGGQGTFLTPGEVSAADTGGDFYHYNIMIESLQGPVIPEPPP